MNNPMSAKHGPRIGPGNKRPGPSAGTGPLYQKDQGTSQCGWVPLGGRRHTYSLPAALYPTQPISATLQNAPGVM